MDLHLIQDSDDNNLTNTFNDTIFEWIGVPGVSTVPTPLLGTDAVGNPDILKMDLNINNNNYIESIKIYHDPTTGVGLSNPLEGQYIGVPQIHEGEVHSVMAHFYFTCDLPLRVFPALEREQQPQYPHLGPGPEYIIEKMM